MKVKSVLISLVLLLFLMMPLFAGTREALVIGNEKYEKSPLNNPVNDARAVKEKLENLGFNVSIIEDADRDTINSGLRDFYKRSNDAEYSLLYYSGHGVEIDGANYLIPVDCNIADEEDIDDNAVSVNKIVDKISVASGKFIIILDACRSNPLKKSRGSSKGLAVVTLNSASEGMIVFSCAAGETADDGDGEHSPFTEALLNHIEDKASLHDVMMRVRGDLKNTKQVPHEDSTLTENIYLNGVPENEVNPSVVIVPDEEKGINPVTLSIILFCALLVIVLVLFAALTDKGKKIALDCFNKVKNFKKDCEKRNYKRQEKIESEFAEMKCGEKFFMKSSLIDKKLYVARIPVTINQFNQITGMKLEGNPNYPVTGISYYDAVKYLNLLSRTESLEPVYDLTDESEIKADFTRNGWRLPTVSEWRRAAKGSTFDANTAWYSDNSDNEVHACGLKEPGYNGLYDMFGLVWEWCEDTVGKYKVLKGGSWDSSEKFCKASSILKVVPQFASDAVGFRGVRNK